MKLSCMKVVVLAVGMCVAVFVVPGYGVGITGSAHDFSTDAWSDGTICGPCHTPHNAKANYEPLWNHDVTTQTFTLYSSDTFDAADPNQPTDSKLCLSCHDGTIGLGDFGGSTGTTTMSSGSDAYIGIDLSNMHPIGFTYNAALATDDGGLFDPSTNSGLGGTITDDMLGSTGNMSCASCHDVHDAGGIAKLLHKTNAASALCLTCHNK